MKYADRINLWKHMTKMFEYICISYVAIFLDT